MMYINIFNFSLLCVLNFKDILYIALDLLGAHACCIRTLVTFFFPMIALFFLNGFHVWGV